MRTLAANHKTRYRLPILLLFVTMTLMGVLDLIFDAPGDLLGVHFVVDLSFVLLCFGATTYLCWSWHRTRCELAGVRNVLAERQAERDAWQDRARRFMQGLGEAIDGQLRRWGLTPVERQTAFLLLKGYSHKEIARLTERSERTVRQHAVGIYRKSGLAGRAELSAFFLEDMLLPLDEPRPGGKGPEKAIRPVPAAAVTGREPAWRPAVDGAPPV